MSEKRVTTQQAGEPGKALANASLRSDAIKAVARLKEERPLLGFNWRHDRALTDMAADLVDRLLGALSEADEAALHCRVALYLISKNYKVLPIGLAKGKTMTEIEAMSVAVAEKMLEMLKSGEGPESMESAMAGYLAGHAELARQLAAGNVGQFV